MRRIHSGRYAKPFAEKKKRLQETLFFEETNERTNERTKKRRSERTDEQTSKRTNGQHNIYTKRTNE